MTKSFASDNYSGIHPFVLQAITDANKGHLSSYGNDPYSERAKQLFRSMCGEKTDVLFVFNGTGANVIAIQCMVNSFDTVFCTETAHIYTDECGAPVKHTGAMLCPIATPDGKLTPELIAPHIKGVGNMHNSQPRVVSISQSTEIGTVYSVEELKRLCDFAHSHGLYVHLDGTRISNAVASLNVPVKTCTADCGVDIMSFGGTKNGMMIGEALLIFNPELSKNAQFIRKQTTQLYSKMRFIAAQFIAVLETDLWLKMAQHSNRMAKILEQEIRDIEQIKITQPVDANGVFALIPPDIAEPLQKEYFFYLWDEIRCEARWMCSFDTTEEDVHAFVHHIRKLIK